MIFRAELGIYLGQLLLLEIITKRLSFTKLLKHSVPAGIALLGMCREYCNSIFSSFFFFKSDFDWICRNFVLLFKNGTIERKYTTVP